MSGIPIPNDSIGVIHVGAFDGVERNDYASLNVLWIEPIDYAFNNLNKNIAPFPKQIAVQALLSDKVGEQVVFHIANNGASSSILPLKEHALVWPEVEYVNEISMTTDTLDNLVVIHDINLQLYDGMVIDVQGVELAVLRGAERTIQSLRWVVAEASNFEAYAGCSTDSMLVEWMTGKGFTEVCRVLQIQHDQKMYWDILWKRQ